MTSDYGLSTPEVYRTLDEIRLRDGVEADPQPDIDPAILGAMIGSALVGTFLGILLAYAVVEPLGGLMEQRVDEGSKELQCIKTTLLASMQGASPTNIRSASAWPEPNTTVWRLEASCGQRVQTDACR